MATILLRKGTVAGTPALAARELALNDDQFRLLVGSAGGNRILGLLHKIDATTAPTVNDDAGDGFSVGSTWIDTTADKGYECADSTVGAAVWNQRSGAGTGGLTQLTGDVTAGPGSGSVVATIANNTVTYAKMQDASATSRVLVRKTAGAGDWEEGTAAEVLAFVGATQGQILYRDASGWTVLAPGTSGQFLQTLGAAANPAWATLGMLSGTGLRGMIDGYILSFNSTSILNYGAGTCRDELDNYSLALAAGNKVCQSSGAWSAGTTGNGLNTGARAASTWYHVWSIAQTAGANPDILFDVSATAPSMPSGYNTKRRIGSFKTDSSTNIINFIQRGDEFFWLAPVADVSAANPGTAAVTRTLTVPTGVRVKALLGVGFAGAAPGTDNPGGVLITDLSLTDTAPSGATNTIICYNVASNVMILAECWTNTSGQVRSRCQLSQTNMTLNISTRGWIDPRGRNVA